MAETFLLKNILSPQLVQLLGRRVKTIYPDFDEKRFGDFVIPKLEPLALKERAKLMASALHEFLPNTYEDSISILISVMQTPLTEEDNLGRYKEFFFMPIAEFISQYGQEYFHESMRANYELTKCLPLNSAFGFLLRSTQKSHLPYFTNGRWM